MSRAEKVTLEVPRRGTLLSMSPLITECPASEEEGLGSRSWGWEWGHRGIKNRGTWYCHKRWSDQKLQEFVSPPK